MKIKTFVLLTFCAYSLNIFSQNRANNITHIDYRPYYQMCYIAAKHYENKEYATAFDLYSNVFEKYEPLSGLFATSYVNYIKAAELSNSCYPRFLSLKTLIEKVGYLKSWILDDEVLKLAFQKSGIDNEIYRILRRRYESSVNIDVRRQVVKIIERDQKYRREYNKEDKYERIREADSVNFLMLKTLISNYGYPGYNLIGNHSIDKNHIEFSGLLRHAGKEDLEGYLLNELKEAVKFGRLLPGIYADVYATYVSRHGFPSKYEYLGDIPLEKVNKNRYDVGLPPIEENEN